ncbi:ABC transporter permease [Petrachloros mirabilis]
MRPTVGFWSGVTCLSIIIVGAICASVVAPAGPNVGNITERFTPPVWMTGGSRQHLLGTDHLGRDMLARLLYGGRISLAIGLGAVLLSGSLGVFVGLIAGYSGGLVDGVMMRLVDMQLAIPFLALAILVSAVLGPGVWNVVLVLAVSGWVLYARIVRASVLAAREFDYVLAARAIGATTFHILFRTILPNVVAPALIIGTLSVSQMIITESSLSFLGLGVPPATPTWGTMLSDARDYLAVAWWVPTFPGLAITITVLSVNLVGDWLRDRLDPRLNV